ncbi:MAG: oligosaccharide flippase family protein, partial [Bacteroidia bacterium]
MGNILKVIKGNNILKNFSILTSTNLIIQLLSVLSSIRLARLLQPEGYGRLNFVTVQASLFGIIASFGVRLVVIRTIARNRNSTIEIFKVSNKIRLGATVLAVAVAAIYNLYFVSSSINAFLLFSIIALIVFNNAWDALESVAFGFEKMEASGAINLVFMVLYIITVYLIPPGLFTVNTMVSVFVLQQILKTITYYIWLKRKILHYVAKDFESFTVRAILNQSTYFFFLAIFSAVQNQLPVLFLKTNASFGQIGLFNIGYRILMPLQMVLDVLLTALFPRFSMLAVTDKVKFAKNIKLLLNVLVFTGIIGCVGFTLFSKNVVLLMYGNKYQTSISVIIIQCWYNVLY